MPPGIGLRGVLVEGGDVGFNRLRPPADVHKGVDDQPFPTQ